uniref:PUM-HD domain-containing protein n=2 Tax=Aegilops tauschii subsp. strangulata TaxID=200361 RepID=A0A453L627_AEGTS
KMVAGNALPLIGGKGDADWQPSKDLGSYDLLPASLSGEELAFNMNSGAIHGSWRDAAPDRSGSAPPSMEGSLAELDHLIGKHSGNLEATLRNLSSGAVSSESELCSDPAYLKYYGCKVNLNPRLPAPLVSRESRRLMNRSSKAGEWRPLYDHSSSDRSLTHRSTLSTHKEEPEDDSSSKLDSSSAEDAGCHTDKSTSSIGCHSSKLVGLMQENFHRSTGLYNNSSGPSNTNSGDEESVCCISSSMNSPHDIVKSSDLNGFPTDTPQWPRGPIGSPVRNTLSSNSLAASSPSTSSSSVNNIMGTSQQGNPSTEIKSGGAVRAILNGVDSSMKNLKINLDTQGSAHVKQQQQNNVLLQNGSSHGDRTQMIPQGINLPQVPFVNNFSPAHMNLYSGDIQLMPHHGMPTPFYTQNPYYQNSQLPGVLMPPYGIDGHGLPSSFLPPFMTNFAPQLPVMTPSDTPLTPIFSGRLAGFPSTGNIAVGAEFSNPFSIHEQLGVTMPPSVPDPSLIHYFQQPSMYHYGLGNPYDTVRPSSNFVGNFTAPFGSEKVVPGIMHQSGQKVQFPNTGACSSPTTRKQGSYVGNHPGTSPYISIPMPYPTTPVSHGQPSSGTYPCDRRNGVPGFQSPSKTTGLSHGIQGQRAGEKSDPNPHCSVGEVRSNKAHMVELSDIKGHIAEYSSDQNGSRFIQQKLENGSTEDKALVFAEILPHASSLMTDVFGNYVIQKMFEHGDSEQRRDLAKKLAGHVLTLSLQIYGCRVFQKALEAIELDQKIELVRELDGHVLECVRDQNGNHVIQKCVECVPVEHIGFVVSAFQGQVASLAMHPYGCRVIQRILEHCSNGSDGLVDEILQSTCILAQDQYGNYVTQHVLEKGKAHERSQIISKLARQVVSMSQNKFASNVIEKCFQHGDVAERDLLIKKILEQTEGNNYLLVLMKDQFANYVVQKILETCNGQQRDALVSRMKGHLQALRKYTYGKHIASRIEHFSGDGAVPPGSQKKA